MMRRLRVSAALLCLVGTVVLIAMWLRSYRVADRVHWPLTNSTSFAVASKQGRVALVYYKQGSQPNQWRTGRYAHPVDDGLTFPLGGVRQYESAMGFGFIRQPSYEVPELTFQVPNKPTGWMKTYNGGFMKLRGSALILPYWLGVLLMPILAVAIGVKQPWRFSLRRLLLATTFVACVLGAAVILDK